MEESRLLRGRPYLLLPDKLRPTLSASPSPPLSGTSFTRGLMDLVRAVCVGDYVSRLCLEAHRLKSFNELILVYDGLTRRSTTGPVDTPPGFQRIEIYNTPGGIALDAAYTICELMAEGGFYEVEVHGEEDLLALPAILCSPYRGWPVVFGIPEVGGVIVKPRMAGNPISFSWIGLVPGLR